MAMTLAELLAEAKRLDEAATFEGCEVVSWEEMADAHARIESFYAEHGPRLLAVAEAAVEARIVIKSIIDAHNARLTDGGKLIYSPPTMGTGFIGAIEWLAAFDAAASGEGRG